MITVHDFLNERSDADLAQKFGRHRSYWTHVRNGRKRLSRPAALAIWRSEGVRLGPIAEMDEADIAVLVRLEAAQ